MHAVENLPYLSRIFRPARPEHLIGGASHHITITLGVLLHDVRHSFRGIRSLPPVIHRVRIKDPIEGHPRLYPELSHGRPPYTRLSKKTGISRAVFCWYVPYGGKTWAAFANAFARS